MSHLKKTETDLGTYVIGRMQSTGRTFWGFIARKKTEMELITKERYERGISEAKPPPVPEPPF